MTKDVGNLRTKLSFEKSGDSNLTDLQRDLKGIRSEMTNFQAGSRTYRTSMEGMRKESDILSRRLDVQRERVAELKRRYDEAKETTGENSARTKDLAAQYNNAQAQMKRTEGQLGRLNEIIKVQSSHFTQLGQAMQSHGEQLQSIGSKVISFGRSYTTRVTTPILGAGIAAIKVGMDFEEGMSKVQAISGATAEEMEKLSEQAKDLGEKTRYSATQAAEGQEFLARAGWETSEILAGMPGLLDLAASSNMELGRSADITSNIMAAFNIEAENAGYVADVLAKSSANANTDVEQMGEAMKYLAPTASTLGISMENSAAAVMAFSDAGIQGGMAGRAFGTSLTRLSKPTDQMAGVMEELNVSFFDAEGSMKSLEEIVEELEVGMSGYTKEQRSATLATLFGSEAQRHWAILLDRGSESLKENTVMLQDAEGAAKEMADIMQDNAKGALTEFRSALEGAGIAASEHVLPSITEMTKGATNLVRKFGELDEQQQQQILKWAGITAAIGPASLIIGQVVTTTGKLLSVGGRLLTGLGAMGATGGPVFLAAAGIGVLGYKLYDVYQESNKLHDVSVELADEMLEQHATNEVLINSFDELREKSNLTNEQFADYLDLQTRIANETDPEKIEVLQQEMDMLQKHSGLSNKELEKMVKYNNDVIEAIPESTSEITEQGNRVADTTDKLRDYNDELRKMAARELEQQFQKALSNYLKRVEDLKHEQDELNTLVEYEEFLKEKVLDLNNKSFDVVQEELQAEADRIENALLFGGIKEDEIDLHNDELELINKVLDNMAHGEEQLREHYALHMATVDKQFELVQEKEKELDEINEIVQRMTEQQLIAAGISDEQAQQLINEGRTTEYLNEQLEKLKEQKSELDKKYPIEQRSSEEYRNQAEEINKQIGRLQTAKSNIQGLTDTARSYNDELGRKVEKQVGVYTNPSIDSINDILSRPINKSIRLQGHDFSARAYADGTNHHPGGPFIAGEEGWELGRLGNRYEVLNAGFYDRPKGYQVFTHEQSKRIMKSLSNVPKYASGTNMKAETNRIVNRAIEPEQPIIIEMHITSEIDGRVAGKAMERYVTDLQNLNEGMRERFA